MKVWQLIAQLQKCDTNADVMILRGRTCQAIQSLALFNVLGPTVGLSYAEKPVVGTLLWGWRTNPKTLEDAHRLEEQPGVSVSTEGTTGGGN